ncbi:MAG: HAMP domain-containing histidine kinase [Granulosicoccus sp.]|nr:HAMP domain-containing histidine kinase [Granulosicoccus sp.]
MLASSLSLRLLGIFVVTAVLVMLILIALFTRGLSVQWARSIRPHLVQYVQYVQQDLGSPPQPARAAALARRLPVDIYIFRAERLLHSTTSRKLDIEQLDFEPVARHLDGRALDWQDRSAPSGVPIASLSHQHGPHRILRILDGEYTIYYDLRESNLRRGGRRASDDELLLALAALALVLSGSYLLIRQQLSPIRQIQKSVGIMSEGTLSHRIARKGNSDLDELANSIDAMASRLQAILDAKRQLLIALSHELRSPITRARINAELLPESRNRSRLLEDLSDMEQMIRDIMESEQLQGQHAVLNLEKLDLAELFRTELARLAPGTELQLGKSGSTLPFSGDATRLRIMLRNLVHNAQQHGKSKDGKTHLQVFLEAKADGYQLRVEDEGPGISREHLGEVSDPFYRPDVSRSRETGGFGLGLTLARLVAEAHGGELSIESDPALRPGTCVRVQLPLRQRT